jgi:hypothetical protein
MRDWVRTRPEDKMSCHCWESTHFPCPAARSLVAKTNGLSWERSDDNIVYISHLSRRWYTSLSPRPTLFHISNRITWRVQIMLFSPSSYYFFFLASIFSSQACALKHPQTRSLYSWGHRGSPVINSFFLTCTAPLLHHEMSWLVLSIWALHDLFET